MAAAAGRKIRVLCVDDSALVRQILREGLAKFPDIDVVGVAPDPYFARDKLLALRPDVMTLDIEMPRMDGVEFLRKLMPQFPVPTIIVSSLTPRGGTVTLQALEAGAIDFVTKPGGAISLGLQDLLDELAEKIRMASRCDVSHWRGKVVSGLGSGVGGAGAVVRTAAPTRSVLVGGTERVIALGASTGGTEAFKKVLKMFPVTLPGVVVVQHMPAGFTARYAETLDALTELEVREAKDGDRIVPGTVLIAPGGLQLRVIRSGGQYRIRLTDEGKVGGHAPAVDVLFRSVAAEVGSNGVGVLLTGMGKDGAEGLLEMRRSGAPTFAQDEATSVVWGMPGEAFRLGAAEKMVPIELMGEAVMRGLERRSLAQQSSVPAAGS
jgi:two-component system chemotaxis response regulator CheB